MSNALLVRKVVERVAKSLTKPNTGDGESIHDDESWKVKSSNMHPSDADSYLGNFTAVRVFRKDEIFDANGNFKENDEIGDHVTYLNYWDADNTSYLENKDVKRDNGIGYQMNAMDQITPIK